MEGVGLYGFAAVVGRGSGGLVAGGWRSAVGVGEWGVPSGGYEEDKRRQSRAGGGDSWEIFVLPPPNRRAAGEGYGG